MAFFDSKNFNAEVYGKYLEELLDYNMNLLLSSGAIKERPDYAALLRDQVGGHYATFPIKDRIGGKPVNYDGKTDIPATNRETYTHSLIVKGDAIGWTELDFSTDITGGEDFMPAAQEQADFWRDYNQNVLLAVLKGMFRMSGGKNGVNDDFVESHTYREGKFNEITVNNAAQKALGDQKNAFNLLIVHSAVATHLENLGLVEYKKWTDPNGVETDITLATINGRTILIDDGMPVEPAEERYERVKPQSLEAFDALRVVAESAGDGEIALEDVEEDIADIKVGEYVKKYVSEPVYTSYLLGLNSIEFVNCGAKVPVEVWRDPAKNGGLSVLYNRQRVSFSAPGISYTDNTKISPELEDLENGANWAIDSGEGDAHYPLKGIRLVQIKTRG